MKNLAPVLIASLVSAVVAIAVYRHLEGPRQILIRQAVPVAYTDDDYLSDTKHVPITFSGPAATLKADGFVKASYIGTKAVVAIQSSSTGGYWRGDGRGASTGSGVIIDPDGYIATNNHVISDGGQINVTLNDQREYRASVVGRDPSTDMALLKIEADDLPYLQWGNSDSVFLGEWVLAVGNPFRLQSTVTAGIVSAKGRNIQILSDAAGIESFIQTDAAVNPGNSGGALINTRGELVGINTAIITYSGQYEGFSFAIPGNLAKKVLYDLRHYGSVQRGWMGVTIRPVNSELARQLKLDRVAGVYLESVIENSASHVAGLQTGDVIISVNDVAINSTPEFMEHVGRRRPGDKIQLRYIRKGSEKTTQVVLSNERAAAATFTRSADEELLEGLGLTVRELSGIEKSRLRTRGVIVETIRKGSTIARTNMEPEYIITTVNSRPISSVDDLVSEIRKAKDMVLFDGFYEKFPDTYPYTFRKEDK